MRKPVLFDMQTDINEKFSVQKVNSDKIDAIAEDITCMDYFLLNNNAYVIAFEKISEIFYVYRFSSDKGSFFEEISESMLSVKASALATINNGETVLCLAYDATSGDLSFLNIDAELSIDVVYKLNIGKGVTTLKTFIYRKQLYFIAYNIETGHVSKYEIYIDKSSQAVSAQEVWKDCWAEGWTRFSFFQLGAENFFIKTNIKYSKVNIDHFMDDSDEGSHPVLNIDVPEQMDGLNNVNAFSGAWGYPFFATYRVNGEITFNSIYGNCLGWNMESELYTESNRYLMLVVSVSDKYYLMLY